MGSLNRIYPPRQLHYLEPLRLHEQGGSDLCLSSRDDRVSCGIYPAMHPPYPCCTASRLLDPDIDRSWWQRYLADSAASAAT